MVPLSTTGRGEMVGDALPCGTIVGCALFEGVASAGDATLDTRIARTNTGMIFFRQIIGDNWIALHLYELF
jgi:hypothetical protein